MGKTATNEYSKKEKIVSMFKTQIWQLIKVHLFFLLTIFSARLFILFYFGDTEKIQQFPVDIFQALFLGLRLDLTVVGYIQSILTILLIFIFIVNRGFKLFLNFAKIYLIGIYSIALSLTIADLGFFSFFKEHINLLFFGIIDDDQVALLKTVLENYPVTIILSGFFGYIFLSWKLINIWLKEPITPNSWKYPKTILFLLLIFNFLIIRGTFGMYPLGKMLPNVSTDKFINLLPQNGVRSFIDALKQRKKLQNHSYNLIKDINLKNGIIGALKTYINLDMEDISLDYLKQKTQKNPLLENEPPNIIFIMVESFGVPPLDYQSEKFDIMGHLKKHFETDFVFKNFISSGNGTIESLEALVLNLPARPNTLPIVETENIRTKYKFAPAYVYKKNGYQTEFIYGGDLSWRNIAPFLEAQGFDEVLGKINIYHSVKDKFKTNEFFHTWGIFDEYLYEYILMKLKKKSNKPKFIFALTTNNHPPYTVPKHWKNPHFEIPEALKKHIVGSLDLAKQRFFSFQYALDSLGVFLNKFKKSKFAKNTIIVVTADNHTADGIMNYDNNQLLNSKRIPFYIYLPEKYQPENIDTKVFGSHKDIFPTLYNLTLSNAEYYSIGFNLLDKSKKHIGFNSSKITVSKNGAFQLKSYRDKNISDDLKFYKASLVLTQFLLNSFSQKLTKEK